MDKLRECPFCGGEALEIVTCMQIEECAHFEECPAAEPYVCMVCSIDKGGCGASTGYYDSAEKAVAAWNRRTQPANEPCVDCSGIVYRQTASGKIIPADQRCGGKLTPPCYQPDGDGCAYQIYGDNDDEPTDKCKECPLCYADKVRHKKPENEPLTRCENCNHWDKSISFMSAHACAYCSPSRSSPRYTQEFDFCSFVEAKPERSEGEW